MPAIRKGKITAAANSATSPDKQKAPKRGRKAAAEGKSASPSPSLSDALQKVHSQIADLGEDGVKKVASRHVPGVQGGRIAKRGGKIGIKKKVIRQLEALTPSAPSEAKSKSEVAQVRVSVRAQIAKRGVNAQVTSLGHGFPITRIAHTDVKHGLPLQSGQRGGMMTRKAVDDGMKKALKNELERIASETPIPSVAAAKVGMSYAKTAVQTQLLKRAVVKDIGKRGAQ
ncbi:hypothetical protein SeMB42_g01822 [Synchytrium endobioticum]|uniref:Uncharacterized protein n=1 Tax=Synchytrium endobioticum TaxID=286115 RepID=A0A507DJH3_9FUNG|nr:hypothetical protein SeLEV6574_g01523 [Synchytrium endobioticum]TPX51784.1 hypothetical protein SeMB42_g01822 [Synchytrium endobioticum]